MTEQEKENLIISPWEFFPHDIHFQNVRGNRRFLECLLVYVEVLKECEYWESERIQRIQYERLKNLVTYLSNHSDFWRGYFRKHGYQTNVTDQLGQLQRLPVTDRTFFLKFEDKVVVTGGQHSKLYTKYSSGTCGIPTKTVADEREMSINYFSCSLRHRDFNSQHIRDILSRKCVFILGRCGARFQLSDFTVDTWSDSPLELERRSVREGVYIKIKKNGPIMLVGNASLVLKFARCSVDDNVQLPIFAVQLTSDPISLDDELFIRNTFHTPTSYGYSGSGNAYLGFRCTDGGGVIPRYHINMERTVLDIVDGNGMSCGPDQEGNIVITSLDRRTTPNLRNLIGDVGKIVPDRCLCGRTAPLLELVSRRGHEVVLPSGKKVRAFALINILNGQELHPVVKQFQIQQDTFDRIRILIVPKKAFGEDKEMHLRSRLTECLEGEMAISFEYVREIPRGRGTKPTYFVPLNYI
jgi:phenylacetate-CoA ligase